MDLKNTFISIQRASRKLVLLSNERINEILNAIADEISNEMDFLLSENKKDLDRMDLLNPKYDRLKLTKERLNNIAEDIRNVATLPSPLGRVLAQIERPNGLTLTKVSVPFGVIGIIYEADRKSVV